MLANKNTKSKSYSKKNSKYVKTKKTKKTKNTQKIKKYNILKGGNCEITNTNNMYTNDKKNNNGNNCMEFTLDLSNKEITITDIADIINFINNNNVRYLNLSNNESIKLELLIQLLNSFKSLERDNLISVDLSRINSDVYIKSSGLQKKLNNNIISILEKIIKQGINIEINFGFDVIIPYDIQDYFNTTREAQLYKDTTVNQTSRNRGNSSVSRNSQKSINSGMGLLPNNSPLFQRKSHTTISRRPSNKKYNNDDPFGTAYYNTSDLVRNKYNIL